MEQPLHGGGNFLVCHGHDIVDERLHVRERDVARPQREQTVGDAGGPCRASPERPAASDAVIRAAPTGSTPTTRTEARIRFDRGADAGNLAAAPDGHVDRPHLANAARESPGPVVPWPAMIHG